MITYSNDALKIFDQNLEDFVQDMLGKDNDGDFVNEDIVKILAGFTDLRLPLAIDYNAYALLDKVVFTMPKPPVPLEDDGLRLIISFLEANKAGRSNVMQLNIRFFTDVWVFSSVEAWYIRGHDGRRYSKSTYLSYLVNELVLNSSTMTISRKPALQQPPFAHSPAASANYMGYRSVYSVVN